MSPQTLIDLRALVTFKFFIFFDSTLQEYGESMLAENLYT
jgi:hypothetical protein